MNPYRSWGIPAWQLMVLVVGWFLFAAIIVGGVTK